ncbi:flagellar export chaperone FliS [Methylovorus menthalis]|uniref:flagellar export chaperone FliS n=1 Tax=Methylovorus menthalis TaxID=1002227 RepID=UPI001E436C6E|nr:flagellar export chaperone FliS [Methylovorus menthalis]MCB4812357.1 flagellar export chaperone FliS [Methylovorus menthalis]
MFGSSRGVNEYSRVGVETGVVSADPHKLVVMLYEGAMTACHTAVMHIDSKDFERKGAMISKAIMIIESGLRLSLDKKAGGEIATSLDALYGYMSDRLYMANIKNDSSLIQEVIRLLGDLKSAWETIGTQVAPEGNQFQRVQNYAKA